MIELRLYSALREGKWRAVLCWEKRYFTEGCVGMDGRISRGIRSWEVGLWEFEVREFWCF